jgi:hypothetical protein
MIFSFFTPSPLKGKTENQPVSLPVACSTFRQALGATESKLQLDKYLLVGFANFLPLALCHLK